MLKDPSLVKTRDDFVAFVEDLRTDLLAGNHYWQNTSLESFLDVIAEWTADSMDEYFERTGQSQPASPWELFAEILYAAAIYE